MSVCVAAGERRQIREISANIGDIKRFVNVLKWGFFSSLFFFYYLNSPRFSPHNCCFLLSALHSFFVVCGTVRWRVAEAARPPPGTGRGREDGLLLLWPDSQREVQALV